jgi:hypothetical protein
MNAITMDCPLASDLESEGKPADLVIVEVVVGDAQCAVAMFGAYEEAGLADPGEHQNAGRTSRDVLRSGHAYVEIA